MQDWQGYIAYLINCISHVQLAVLANVCTTVSASSSVLLPSLLLLLLLLLLLPSLLCRN
jgi:hypothetical protein